MHDWKTIERRRGTMRRSAWVRREEGDMFRGIEAQGLWQIRGKETGYGDETRIT